MCPVCSPVRGAAPRSLSVNRRFSSRRPPRYLAYLRPRWPPNVGLELHPEKTRVGVRGVLPGRSRLRARSHASTHTRLMNGATWPGCRMAKAIW